MHGSEASVIRAETKENAEAELLNTYRSIAAHYFGMLDEVPEFKKLLAEEQDMLASGVSEEEIKKLSNIKEREWIIYLNLWRKLFKLHEEVGPGLIGEAEKEAFGEMKKKFEQRMIGKEIGEGKRRSVLLRMGTPPFPEHK